MHALPGSVWGVLQDVHAPQAVAGLSSLCTACLQLQPAQGLLQEVAALQQGLQGQGQGVPHGQLQLRLKRHTGRVRVEGEVYSLHQDASLHTTALVQEAITAQLLAAHAVQQAGQLLVVLHLSAMPEINKVSKSKHSQAIPGCAASSCQIACSTTVQQMCSCMSILVVRLLLTFFQLLRHFA